MSYPVDIEQQMNHINDDEPVILNVGGVKYEVMPSTLAQYPETRLGEIFHPNNRHLRKPDKKGEFFFDRNGRMFEVILNYYRTGKLVIPSEFSEEIIREEIKYFRIEYNGNGVGGNKTTEEDEDEKIMRQPKDQIYQYASGLIHSSSRRDIKRGLKFLGKLRESEPTNYLYRYNYSFACYRLGENAKGIESLEDILSTDQHNPQAKSLLTLFNDVRISNTRNGIVVLCVVAASVFCFIKVRKWYSLAQLVNSNAPVISAVSNVVSNVAQGNTPSLASVGAAAESIIKSAISHLPPSEFAIDTIPESLVATAITTPVENVITQSAYQVTGASLKSLAQSNVQSVSSDQFNNLISNTFSSSSK